MSGCLVCIVHMYISMWICIWIIMCVCVCSQTRNNFAKCYNLDSFCRFIYPTGDLFSCGYWVLNREKEIRRMRMRMRGEKKKEPFGHSQLQ